MVIIPGYFDHLALSAMSWSASSLHLTARFVFDHSRARRVGLGLRFSQLLA